MQQHHVLHAVPTIAPVYITANSSCSRFKAARNPVPDSTDRALFSGSARWQKLRRFSGWRVAAAISCNGQITHVRAQMAERGEVTTVQLTRVAEQCYSRVCQVFERRSLSLLASRFWQDTLCAHKTILGLRVYRLGRPFHADCSALHSWTSRPEVLQRV